MQGADPLRPLASRIAGRDTFPFQSSLKKSVRYDIRSGLRDFLHDF